MALETLKEVNEINGHVVAHFPDEQEHPIDKCTNFIKIDHDANEIRVKIQNGPIKEHGVNGCQIDILIETAKTIIEGLNKKFPCRENALTITKLDEALMWLRERTRNRQARGVEGESKA